MKLHEISEVAKCTTRSAYNFKAGKGFGKNRAVALERRTGVHRLHWMFPNEYDEHGQPVQHGAAPAQPQEAPNAP